MNLLQVAALGIGAASLFAQIPAVAAPAQGDGGQCRVVIDRSQAPGTFDVTRQTGEDDKCVCYAYTGPMSQGEPTESRISALMERKSCPDAKAMAVAGRQCGLSGGSCAGAGPLGFLGGGSTPLLIGAAVTAVAVAVAASSGSEEGTPISP